jgi:hypothetical protein
MLELRPSRLRCLFEPTRGTQQMPLLFYFPYIIWMGMMEIVQEEMRASVTIKARTPARR